MLHIQNCTFERYNGYARVSIHELYKLYLDSSTVNRYNLYIWARIHDLYNVHIETPNMKGKMATDGLS
jgi:hypothetical protein